MRRAHTVEQVRAAEATLRAQLPEGTLMQRAASGLATAVADLLGRVYGARVLLLVGSGDNGADALYAGALLARRGAGVEAVLLSDSADTAGVLALHEAGGRVVELADAHEPQVLLDGIVGIGGRPGLREDAVEALGRFPAATVVAVDTPSGIDVDTGRLDGPHVRADLTVTFGTHKIAHFVDPAAQACGTVQLVDIGLDPHLPEPALTALQPEDVAGLVPRPGEHDQKYTRGVVGVRAGSAQYPGAAVLCTSAAVCGLAGMVRFVPAGDSGDPQGHGRAVADAVRARHPEIVAGTGRVQVWVVGSGGGDDAEQALADARADGVPLVLDADALRFFDGGHDAPVVLTPHAGELAGMLGLERTAVEASMVEHAQRAAERYDAVVLLKGGHTLVAHPDGRLRVSSSGVPWLAVAGAGDVLSGLIGALVAAGLDAFDAASAGSWLHGAAAAYASDGGPLQATAVAAAIPAVVRRLLDPADR